MAVNRRAAGHLPMKVDRASATPIAVQLRDQFTWLIAARVLSPGDRLPSIRSLAGALGIHHHTVRAVYADLRAVGLVTMRQGSGAVVSDHSSLQLSRPSFASPAGVIGVLIAGYDPFYLPFLQGVERVAADMRALTIVCVTEDSPVKARLQIGQLVARGVNGVIAASLGQLLRDELAPVPGRSRIPIVYCDQPDQPRDSIVFDAPAAGREMAAHMAGHGHKSITVIAPSLGSPNVAALHSGFERAVAEGLIDEVTHFVAGGFGLDAGARAARAVLTSGGHRPSAIATAGDILALGVLSTARELRVQVPADLALISYGQIDVAGFVEPPLSTVALAAEEMGAMAAEHLRRAMNGDAAPIFWKLPTTLVPRQSCGSHEAG